MRDAGLRSGGGDFACAVFAGAVTFPPASTAAQHRKCLPPARDAIYLSFTEKEEETRMTIVRTFETMMVGAAFFMVSAVVIGLL